MAKINSKIREHIYNRDGYECLRCNAKENLTIDHVIPLSKGGVNRIGNMQTLCVDCNCDKGDLMIDYRWIEHLPKSWFNLSIPINEVGITDEQLPIICETTKNPFAEPKKKKLKEIVKELGFYDNPFKLMNDLEAYHNEKQQYLQNQTHEQLQISKKHGWKFAKMITEPSPNFHYED